MNSEKFYDNERPDPVFLNPAVFSNLQYNFSMASIPEIYIPTRYRLQDKLGQGGMGVVYRATDRLTGSTIALKQVQVPAEYLQFMSRPSETISHSLQTALGREFQTLATLRHPNIISVLDYGFVQTETGPQPFYTMTYLPEAETLLDAGKELSINEKLDLVQQTLQGLAYLHRRGILHRDMKPENVLVVDGQVRILDFGLALSQREARKEDAPSGSSAYLAPELWEDGSPGIASDLYALGVMAFELLGGQHPFGTLDHGFVDRVLDAAPDLDLMGVNDDLCQVIAKLLAKSPDARYHHAGEVQATLHSAQGQQVPPETSLIRESFLQAAAFVGRKTELDQLTEALEQTVAEQSPVWLIGGESGVGKTRLADEVRIQAMLQGLTILRGQSVEGGSLPFQLWREPVRRLLLMHPDIPDLQAGILKDIVPDMDGLLDRGVVDAPKLDGRAYQQRLILAILDLFRNLSEPVLLLLEDLQWAGESLAVLQQMLKVIEQFPGVMVLGNYRHDERPDLPEELSGAQTLILERLEETEVAKLSQAMLGEVASSPHIVSLLTQETEGNTFFIVEVMRALAEEAGQLDEIGRMTLPEGVFTGGMARLMRRRIQKVAVVDQALLQLAAVVGRQLDVAVLGVLAPDKNIPAWQHRVGDAAVLSVRDDQWEFAHDKLRETLLDELTREEQRELHRQVAEALETVYPEDSSYHEALLGHWHQAGDLDKEIQYLELVAQHLIQITGAHEQAHALLRRGLALLPPTDERRVALLNQQAVSSWRQGDYAQCQELAWQAREFAAQLGDQQGIANSLNSLGLIAYFQGEYATAHDYQRKSLAIGQAIDDQPGIANTLMHLGNIALHQSDDTAALDYQQQSLTICQALGDQRGIAANLGNLGMIVAGQGDHIAARDYHQRSLAIFEAIGDQQGIANSLSNLGFVAYDQRDYAAARDYHQQSLTIIQTIGDQWGIANALINLSFVHLHLRSEQAQPSLHRSLAIAQDIQAVPLILEAVMGFARFYLQGIQAAHAAELCGLVQHHPTFDSEVQIRLDELLPQLKERLPSAELQAALERGKTLDLDTVVAELLEEVGEDNA